MANRFFNEDTVALKEDPEIIAVVEHTWRDIDSAAFQQPDDWIRHPHIRKGTFELCEREGRPPTDHVIIRFIKPYGGATLLPESALVLKDRGLVVGDVVKRLPSDPQSGSVIKTSTACTLCPVYTDLPYHGSEPWPHKASENELKIPEEELMFQDFQIGDHVIYRDWVGEVMDVFEEVTVRLENGSVVRVQNAEELEILDMPPEALSNSKKLRLIPFLKQKRDRVEKMGSTGPTMPADYFHPGQRVFTKKGNLRLGTWIIGSYSPSVPPRGIVVEVRVFQISVNWIASNMALAGLERTDRPDNPEPPWETVDGNQLNEVKLYNRNNLPSPNGLAASQAGSSQGCGMAVGDFVKFHDVAGAAVKYSAESPNRDKTGVFRRIPRMMTQGFEMNMFWIRSTDTAVWVQWQDGSVTEENSTSLLPYLNVDDHDLWVGEICSLKSQEIREDGVIVLKHVGVVQSVNARERTARIRWFKEPQVRIFQDRTSVFVPGSVLGPLSDSETSVSVYEVVAYSALTKRRGDLVLIFPRTRMLARRSQHPQGILSSIFNLGNQSDHEIVIPPDEARWFGEVIDLGTDGLLTVRLGAMNEVQDVRVPVERILTVVGGDDQDFYSEGGEEDDDYDSSDDYDIDEEEVIDETIEYEGGTRMDDDADDDAWMTDGEEDKEKDDRKSYQADHNHQTPNGISASPIANGDGSTSPAPKFPPRPRSPDTHEEYNFASYSDMPEPFAILDEPTPLDHHYLSKASRLSAPLLRRIRKEHSILSDSLPPGIWVRTWADRLDLLRILIIGPRGTPYELAPFVLDFHLRDEFPQKPPEVYFHSWTFGVGRINPNLYEEGTVCLSVLGTWPEGEKTEAWNPERSSVLQVVVSLLGLVLVAEPFYNEAGFESLVGTEETLVPSSIYTEKAFCMAKGFVAHALSHDVAPFKPILDWIYVKPGGPEFLKLVVEEAQGLISKDDAYSGRKTRVIEKLTVGAEILLQPHLRALEAKLAEIDGSCYSMAH